MRKSWFKQSQTAPSGFSKSSISLCSLESARHLESKPSSEINISKKGTLGGHPKCCALGQADFLQSKFRKWHSAKTLLSTHNPSLTLIFTSKQFWLAGFSFEKKLFLPKMSHFAKNQQYLKNYSSKGKSENRNGKFVASSDDGVLRSEVCQITRKDPLHFT